MILSVTLPWKITKTEGEVRLFKSEFEEKLCWALLLSNSLFHGLPGGYIQNVELCDCFSILNELWLQRNISLVSKWLKPCVWVGVQDWVMDAKSSWGAKDYRRRYCSLPENDTPQITLPSLICLFVPLFFFFFRLQFLSGRKVKVRRWQQSQSFVQRRETTVQLHLQPTCPTVWVHLQYIATWKAALMLYRLCV